MNPLRATINLYYDKILDGIPVPNGITEYVLTNDTNRYPYAEKRLPGLMQTAKLFFLLEHFEVKHTLYTGKQTATKLFYPLELHDWTVPNFKIIDYISKKALKRIVKGGMKLLLFVPHVSHNYETFLKLKERINFDLISCGVLPSNIAVVTGDINNMYQRLFEDVRVYGIDWWQIYCQAIFAKYEQGEEVNFFTFLKTGDVQSFGFSCDEWNPTKTFYSFTGGQGRHNTTFVAEMLYRGLDKYGDYSFNLFNTRDDHYFNVKDPKITRQNRDPAYTAAKEFLINNLRNVCKNLDERTFKDDRLFPLRSNNFIFKESLFNIISENFFPPLDMAYMNELNVLAPGPFIWREIYNEHPFIPFGGPGIIHYLQNEGYQSYYELFDYKFADITDMMLKSEMICRVIEKYASADQETLSNIINETKPFLKKNKTKFMNKPLGRKFNLLFNEMNNERTI